MIYLDRYGMVLNSASNNEGRGDALWRTGLYMLFNPALQIDGILACIKPGEYYCRHPEHRCDTTSRDQLATVFAAAAIHDQRLCMYLTKDLPWRISDKFSQTIDFWLWVKAIRGSTIALWAWHLVVTVMLLFIVPWNFLWRRITNVRSYSQGAWNDRVKYHEHPAWKKKLWKLLFPTYAFFILVLQLRAAQRTWLTLIINFLCFLEVEKTNHFLRNLIGYPTQEYYEPMIYALRWNNRLDDTNNTQLWFTESPHELYTKFFEGILLDIELLKWSHVKHQ